MPQKKKQKKSAPKKKSVMKKVVPVEDAKVRPLGNRALIRPFTKEELEKKNSFGILLPESGNKEKAEQGIVLAVGPGNFQDGTLMPMTVKVGDTVAFSKYGYDDISIDDEELYLIKEENILAILKK